MSRLWRGVAVVGAAALVGAGLVGPASAATSAAPWAVGDPVFSAPSARPAVLGVNYQGTWNILTDTQRAQVLDKMAAAGVGWVRLDMGWISFQPDGPSTYSMGDLAGYDKHVRELRSRGIKILVQFGWAPKWASGTSDRSGRPKDPTQYANAAAWLVKQYDGTRAADLKVDAIELWNEPDQAYYWNPEPAATRVSDFATLIKTAGPAIKKANPNVRVVVGATSSVDTDWYTEFYKTPGVIGTYDALGVHPYQSPGDATPETYDPKWGKYFLRHLPALDSLMASKGDPARIWATEYGWSTHANTTTTPNWARGVTEAQQADYLVRSMPVLAGTPRLEAAFWFAALNTTTGEPQFDNYGLLRTDLTPKPALYAYKCAATSICGSTTTPTTPPTPTPSTLVAAGSPWRYNDTGADLGTGWRASSYDASAWKSGNTQMGYGDGDERTTLSFGANTSAKPLTYYFRTSFDAGSDPSAVKGLRLESILDDGAVVYLNGTEIWRKNMPTGTVSFTTRASTYVAGAAETTWNSVNLPVTGLRSGTNVLAVEVHNDSPTSSDISFDLRLRTIQ